jgi:hypothetical protein
VRNGVNIHIFAAPYKTKKAFKGSNLSLLAMSGMQEMHLQKLRPSSRGIGVRPGGCTSILGNRTSHFMRAKSFLLPSEIFRVAFGE